MQKGNRRIQAEKDKGQLSSCEFNMAMEAIEGQDSQVKMHMGKAPCAAAGGAEESLISRAVPGAAGISERADKKTCALLKRTLFM